MEQTEELIRSIQKGLICWYDFRPKSRILYLGNRDDALAEVLEDRAGNLTCLALGNGDETGLLQAGRTQKAAFDYIVCGAVWERLREPEFLFQNLRNMLAPQGVMLLGMNNRLGLRFFCGDRDPYTERSFDGIEGYRRAYGKKEDAFYGRCYSRAETLATLERTGWKQVQFYSVLPNLANPMLLYREDYLPNEDLSNRLFPCYEHPDSVFLEEECLYEGLIQNGMFHQMANAYLAECTVDGQLSDVIHVTGSMDRGRADALLTVIRKSGIVEKRAAYPEGNKRLFSLWEHGKELRDHGVPMVDARLENGVYTMPYIKGEVGQVYLKRLLLTDREKFLKTMDAFREWILQSSEVAEPDKGDGQGAILRKGYLDLVPLNSFYTDDGFLFYDQEFCEENYPANAIITRMIATFYAGNLECQKILPMEELFQRYGLTEHLQRWRRMEWEFLSDLRKEEELRVYHERCRRNGDTVQANRLRVNYSESEYQRLFTDIFQNAASRELILFGSGNFARKFLGMYGKEYPVSVIVDNNESRWGQTLEGVRIVPPEIFGTLEPGAYKVLICIKNYLSVIRQLEELGVRDYSVFDPGRAYVRNVPAVPKTTEDAADGPGRKPKKYHIGYVAGVFDLFHVGHVNLLRRAKELCDYLIVGVVPDKTVYRMKEKYPVIPCEDRVEVIRACRYADRVEQLPEEYSSIRDAYRLFHFDVQFSGDDHSDNTGWLADREFLEKHGADIVFFPYTEKVSSSSLREQLLVRRPAEGGAETEET